MQQQEHRIFFVLTLKCAKEFYVPNTYTNSQKCIKNQKSTDKHSSFDGLIQEDIDLSDIFLAVHHRLHIRGFFSLATHSTSAVLHIVPSMFFYPDFISILSKFYPDKIRMKSG